MKFIRLIALIVVIFLLVIFITQNQGQNVKLRLLFTSQVIEMDMIILVFITFLIGLLLGFLISGIQILIAKNQLRSLNNEYRNLKKEIDLLRNQGIEDVGNMN